MKKLLTLVFALVSLGANAQNISFEVEANEAKISLTGATEMTALQFNLKLPEGVTVNTDAATLGSATDGHTLCIETLDNGDLLFILYNMDLNPFKDGELLRLPVNGSLDGDTSLYTIRYASADAMSHEAEDIITGIEQPLSISHEGEGIIYSVSGQRLSKIQKGINIVGGKKVLGS